MGKALPEDVSNSVVAYYWDGAAPAPHQVRNLSAYGADIVTVEKWYPGTMIQLTLQHGVHVNGTGGEAANLAVSVRTRVVAQNADGVRVHFMCLNNQERHALCKFLHDVQLAEATVTPRPMSASSGQSLIEFALIVPLLVLLVVNVVNFGSFMYAWIEVSNAARAGAQYMIMSGASLGHPRAATSASITQLVQDDLASLVNGATATVRVCTNNNGVFDLTSGQIDASGNPVPCAAGNTDGFVDPEAGDYVVATVDVSYTWQPLIPLFEFPRLGIHATLPGNLTIHRTAVMRMIQ
jgi:Flp pilus assembly protein TadG